MKMIFINLNKKQNNIIPDDHISGAKQKITLFLNVLFNHTKDRIRVKGRLLNHKQLWDFITEEIKNYYKIESKEILLFCKLKCMSIPPFLKAFEYHTKLIYFGVMLKKILKIILIILIIFILLIQI